MTIPAGPVLALDLAQLTGWAEGVPGERPASNTVRLKRPDQPRHVASGNLIAWLAERWKVSRPVLVVVEEPYTFGAMVARSQSEANVRMQYGLHEIVAGMCWRYGIRREEAHVAVVRKHFIGVAHIRERDTTKRAVVQRCHQLGYMTREQTDDNQADALACWDWACAMFMRAPPKELRLFTA